MIDAVISLLITVIGGVIFTIIGERLSFLKLRTPFNQDKTTTTERLQNLIENLGKSSKEADALIQEIVSDLKKRETLLEELQSKNKQLASEEENLKKRIALLKEIPIEVAEYFQKINQQNLESIDKRSSKRDIMFFVLGAVVSAIVQLLLG